MNCVPESKQPWFIQRNGLTRIIHEIANCGGKVLWCQKLLGAIENAVFFITRSVSEGFLACPSLTLRVMNNLGLTLLRHGRIRICTSPTKKRALHE